MALNYSQVTLPLENVTAMKKNEFHVPAQISTMSYNFEDFNW